MPVGHENADFTKKKKVLAQETVQRATEGLNKGGQEGGSHTDDLSYGQIKMLLDSRPIFFLKTQMKQAGFSISIFIPNWIDEVEQ